MWSSAEESTNGQRLSVLASKWASLLAEERALDRLQLPLWERRFASARERQAELVSAGTWRGGPRTLLGALNLQDRELILTAGLAWLLRPDGHHGLGDSFLVALVARLDMDDVVTTDAVQVRLEETRRDTRADLVVYSNTWTLLVEAKVFAVEQPEQLDRLHALWADDPDVRFVFLTSGSRVPYTNVKSHDRWTLLTWSDVADCLSQVITGRSGIAPGVHEYLATLEAYHHV